MIKYMEYLNEFLKIWTIKLIVNYYVKQSEYNNICLIRTEEYLAER